MSETKLKTCTRCDKEFPETNFRKYTVKSGEVRYKNPCNDCKNEISKIAKLRKQGKIPPLNAHIPPDKKECVTCKKILNKKEHFEYPTISGKFYGQCHDCRHKSRQLADKKRRQKPEVKKKEAEQHKKYWEKTRAEREKKVTEAKAKRKEETDKRRAEARKRDEELGKKVCSTCGEEQEINMYFLDKRRNLYNAQCRSCKNKRSEEYKKGDPDIIRIPKWTDNERKKQAEIKHRNDAMIRWGINQFKDDGKFNNTVIDLIGCNYKEYKEYIKYLMDDDMTWDNYGSLWHIDHVIPKSYFDMTSSAEIKLCFHWSNTRPMDGKANYSKSTNIYKSDVKEHYRIVIKYIKEKNIQDLKKTQSLLQIVKKLVKQQ